MNNWTDVLKIKYEDLTDQERILVPTFIRLQLRHGELYLPTIKERKFLRTLCMIRYERLTPLQKLSVLSEDSLIGALTWFIPSGEILKHLTSLGKEVTWRDTKFEPLVAQENPVLETLDRRPRHRRAWSESS